MIIANRLTDGLVVFYTSGGDWSSEIDQGLVLDDPDEQERRLSDAKSQEERCVVIDPYLIEVASDSGHLRPTSIREAIRAFGPTV
jgi:hypothetical protein